MIKLSISEKMLFALLRAALNEREPEIACFDSVSPKEWRDCCQLAIRHGVVILAWDGINRLSPMLQPPHELKISWALAVEKYERKYAQYCQAVCELSEFYRKHGIQLVLLKGVGLSTYYPIPSHREGGDIDIYTCSLYPEKYADKEANALADSLVQQQGIEVDTSHNLKHSHFFYKGIPFENHKTFLDVTQHELAVKVEALLHKCLHPRMVELVSGGKVYIPSPEFNTIFLVFHAAQHYGAGLALHHICDWACLIKQYGLKMPEGLADRHFLRGLKAFTHMCNDYLGTSVPVSGGEKLASEIMEEILHPFDERKVPPKMTWNWVKYKLKQYSYIVPMNNSILHVPLWRNTVFHDNVKTAIGWKVSSIQKFFLRKQGE